MLVRTFFSPRGQCEAAVVARFHDAETSIDCAMYEFTNRAIEQAMSDAKKRGLTVRLIVDKAMTLTKKQSPAQLNLDGVEIRVDRRVHLMHDKYAVIDREIVLTGSFNYTVEAQQANAENLLEVTDAATAAAFGDDFERKWTESEPYRPIA